MRRPLAVIASLVLYACADDDNASPGPKDAGPVPEAGPSDTAADTADTGRGRLVGGCMQSDFDGVAGANGGDSTAQTSITITFPNDSSPAQYKNRCAKVKVGTKVTFTGLFSAHPLEPNGGDTPTPIPMLTNTDPDGGSLVLTVAAKGTFGYECNFHPSIMFGAIQVVP